MECNNGMQSRGDCEELTQRHLRGPRTQRGDLFHPFWRLGFDSISCLYALSNQRSLESLLSAPWYQWSGYFPSILPACEPLHWRRFCLQHSGGWFGGTGWCPQSPFPWGLGYLLPSSMHLELLVSATPPSSSSIESAIPLVSSYKAGMGLHWAQERMQLLPDVQFSPLHLGGLMSSWCSGECIGGISGGRFICPHRWLSLWFCLR